MPAGYEHYEVSNYAKLNKRSQHNMAYWRGYDYVGVGPGAHGRFTQSARRVATVAVLRPGDYTEQVQVKGHGISEQDVLSPEHWGDEYIIMGLRLTDGVSQKRYAQITGRPLNKEYIQALIDMGLLEMNGDNLRASHQGRARCLALASLARLLFLARDQ